MKTDVSMRYPRQYPELFDYIVGFLGELRRRSFDGGPSKIQTAIRNKPGTRDSRHRTFLDDLVAGLCLKEDRL
jgi:hypothetical protein